MLIRPAVPGDVQELALLGERLWRETYTGLIPAANLEAHLADAFGRSQQAAQLADQDSTILVLQEGDSLVGYAWLRACGPEPDWSTRPFNDPLEVARFYLDRLLHGTGAAQSLMAAVLSHAVRAGHDGVWLQVWDQNPRAMSFYVKAGFTDEGETVFPVGDLVYRDRLLVHTLRSY
jgi:GNAT superfamily N-acetyltransferase